ncbi:MAG: hypothetical protein IPH78_12670 [Bacteroidetes bacterium]|nr:hypothetical protein [Bacteroidota bacterium]
MPYRHQVLRGTNTICAGGSSPFTASGGSSYVWSTGATTAAITVSVAGTYTVTATKCRLRRPTNRTLTVNALPTPSVTGTNTICAGGLFYISRLVEVPAIMWSTGATTAAITVSVAGTYTVTATNAAGWRLPPTGR